MEKIDMSLDDIIKLQRKERRKQKANAKKVTLATKPHRPVRGRKSGRLGISPLNRSSTATVEPTSVINGQKSYSARYLKPWRGRLTPQKKSYSSMRSDQLQANGRANRPVQQRLKLRRPQKMNGVVNRSLPTQQRFKQRKRANANLAATRTQNRQQKFNQRRRLNRQTTNNGQRQQQQRPNQRRQIEGQTTNNRQRQQQQRPNQRRQIKRTQTQTKARKTRQIQQPRRQQQTVGPTKRSVGMLKVSISTNSNTKNGPVKLKRNTFYNNGTPNRPNNRVSQDGRRQKQQAKTKVVERTVIF